METPLLSDYDEFKIEESEEDVMETIIPFLCKNNTKIDTLKRWLIASTKQKLKKSYVRKSGTKLLKAIYKLPTWQEIFETIAYAKRSLISSNDKLTILKYFYRFKRINLNLMYYYGNNNYYNSFIADHLASLGELTILKWVKFNGGNWTHWSADWACGYNHLNTFKWILDNGGRRTNLGISIAKRNKSNRTLIFLSSSRNVLN